MKRWPAFICISRQQKFKVRATEFYSVIGKGYREIWTCKYQGERHFSRACPSRLKRSCFPLGKLPLAFALIPYPGKTKKIINSFHDISLHIKVRRILNISHATFILVRYYYIQSTTAFSNRNSFAQISYKKSSIYQTPNIREYLS